MLNRWWMTPTKISVWLSIFVMVGVLACGEDDATANDDAWNVGGNDQPGENDDSNDNATDPADENDPPNDDEPENDNQAPDVNDENDPSEAAIEEVVVEPEAMTVAVGETTQLDVVVTDENGEEVEDFDVSWESDDEEVVSVDDTGSVEGLQAGEAAVVATVEELSGQAQITVEESQWRDVVAGPHVSCAVSWDEELYCWGTDHYWMSNQQDVAQSLYSQPVEVSLPISVAGVTVGSTHYCAWDDEGETYCWGVNTQGQVGAPTTEQLSSPTLVVGEPFVIVNAGFQHACGVSEDGDVYCWGSNESGQLGVSDISDTHEPVEVGIDEPVVDVSAGSQFSCAAGESGSVYCWGRNTTGIIDPWMPADEVMGPTEVSIFDQATQVEVGATSSCVLSNAGFVSCWGFNVYGEVGSDAPTGQIAFPSSINSNERFTDLSMTHHTACGVTVEGAMKCWGDNRFGTVGDDSVEEQSTPVELEGKWENVAVGTLQACGIDDDDQILCWGGNAFGEVGDGRAVHEYSLEPVDGGGHYFDELVAGGHVVCGIDTDTEQTYCWGRNDFAQQQVDRPAIINAPRQLPVWSPMSLALGNGFGCGMGDGFGAPETLQCWGANHHGQLGLSIYTTGSSANPLPVDSLQEFTTVELGVAHGCAIADSGQVYCWGSNEYGQVKPTAGSEYEDEPNPVALEEDDFVDLALGHLHTCGLTSQGEVWCWGANEFGQLGHGMSSGMEEPAKVDFDYEFVAIEAAASHSCGLSEDGEVVCWGHGTFLTGTPDTEFAQSPRVFEGDWEQLAIGDHTICATKDQTLHCGGWDFDGWLGSAIPTAVNDLRPVDEEVEVTDVVVGAGYLCALNDEGEAMCRGGDAFGVLGIGADVIYSEPNPVVMP